MPTPVDDAHQPDFGPLLGASESVGRNLKRGAIVVFESTVYPGATEEICVPVLEQHSGMKWKRDFFVGYSPERINPGDKEHTLTRDHQGRLRRHAARRSSASPRSTAASSRPACYRAVSIKVAEAAKVIENTQRDLNIALMNELALIFHRIGIDTLEVLRGGRHEVELPAVPARAWSAATASASIPYYLTHKADKLGYHPQVILAGRRINDGMGKYIAEQTVKQHDPGGLPGQGRRTSSCSASRSRRTAPTCATRGHRRRPRARSRTASTCTCTTRSPIRPRRCTSTASS